MPWLHSRTQEGRAKEWSLRVEEALDWVGAWRIARDCVGGIHCWMEGED